MPSTDPNPFIIKKYIVRESIINGTAESNLIDDKTYNENITALSQGYTVLDPMNLLELEKYLSDEVNKFIMKVKFARTCDNYAVEGLNIPETCTNTFANYNSSTSTTQFGTGNYVLDNFTYTDSYLNSQKTINDKKQLGQRIRDLQSLLASFEIILNVLDTAEIKTTYPDDYNNIMKKYNQNLSMRHILDQKLDNIYSIESSYSNSKRFLDSTVYTSVLWTILATTLVFYVFKKM